MPQRHRPELVESIAGEPLSGYRRAPRTFRRDRICAAPDCTTRLSIYNSSSYCAAHGPHRAWPLLGIHTDFEPPKDTDDDHDHRLPEEIAV